MDMAGSHGSKIALFYFIQLPSFHPKYFHRDTDKHIQICVVCFFTNINGTHCHSHSLHGSRPSSLGSVRFPLDWTPSGSRSTSSVVVRWHFWTWFAIDGILITPRVSGFSFFLCLIGTWISVLSIRQLILENCLYDIWFFDSVVLQEFHLSCL